MIVRVCKAYIRPGKEKEFEEFTRKEAVPFMKKQKGLVDFSFGWSMTPRVLNVTSVWETFEDVKRFAGADPTKAVVLPNEAHMVEKMVLEHYETMALERARTPRA